MAFLLPLVEAVDFLVAEYEAVAVSEAVSAGAQAMEIEMATVAEGTPLLSASGLASEEATAAYGAVNETEAALESASAVAETTRAIGGAAVAGITAKEVWDSARKGSKRKRTHTDDSKAKKKLRFTVDYSRVHRTMRPAKASCYRGFPNAFTSLHHAFKPIAAAS